MQSGQLIDEPNPPARGCKWPGSQAVIDQSHSKRQSESPPAFPGIRRTAKRHAARLCRPDFLTESGRPPRGSKAENASGVVAKELSLGFRRQSQGTSLFRALAEQELRKIRPKENLVG